MISEEKEAIERLKQANEISTSSHFIYNEILIVLNLIEKQQKELEQEKEKNKELEKHQKQYLDGELITAKQGKFFEKMIKENYIRKDKIKERMEQTKKVYDEEMKPYMIEVGNGEKVLNVTYLSKKEKEELINKRNCLLVQIKTYEMLLEENNGIRRY